MSKGTSPRTRGKLTSAELKGPKAGNIPAHAGKTARFQHVCDEKQEHPRARGENPAIKPHIILLLGTSPRTRGKHLLTCGSSFLKVILHSVLFSRTMGV